MSGSSRASGKRKAKLGLGKKKSHNHRGNCLIDAHECTACGWGAVCDVCHDHEQPRGQCEECEPCLPCRRDLP